MANLPYVQVVSQLTQSIPLANVPQVVVLDTIDDVNEFSVDDFEGIITYEKEGAARKFFYAICPQVGRVGTCQNVIPNFRCWLQFRASDADAWEDVPNSNVLINVNRDRETKDVLPLTGLITLEADNQLRILMASNVSDVVRLEFMPMLTEPNVPSIIVSIFNVGLEKDEEP